jgi:NADPH:quinone reductase-like Zn-dependent oxidoreductase
MKAAVCERYGPPEVLRIADVEAPVPAHDEILVRIHASTVNSSDWYVRSGIPMSPLAVQVPFRLLVGLRRPRRRIIGLILSGEVVEAGRSVTRFKPGDRVWAFTKLNFGAYAEYTCLKEDSSVAIAPAGVTYDEAAAIAYGGLMALHYLRRGNVRSGGRVLVYGASGATGTAAVQIARHAGDEVTAVCGRGNVELVTSLGAVAALDYTTRTRAGGPWRLEVRTSRSTMGPPASPPPTSPPWRSSWSRGRSGPSSTGSTRWSKSRRPIDTSRRTTSGATWSSPSPDARARARRHRS